MPAATDRRPRTAVVILTYRPESAGFDRCLASVVAAGEVDHIVVVDNGQVLERAHVDDLLGALGDDGGVRVDLLRSETNLGFAAGMNAGITHALGSGAEAVALLNDDTLVEAGWAAALAEQLDTTVGAVQPLVLLGRGGDETGGSEVRIASTGMSVRGDGAGVDLGFGQPASAAPVGREDIDLFTGGAVLLSRPFLEDLGGFDERYFMYYEDIDLAARGREAGWRYVLEPRAIVHHAHSATASTTPDLHRYWQERNRLWWLARHGRGTQIARGLVLSMGRLVKHPIRAQARAIIDGLRGMPRGWRERRSPPIVSALPRPVRWRVQ